ncbi:MAG: alpha/beta hydrolase, partial [Actinomycetota bacterium]|nr:alpha/beta hydrolase [Actinomycetota bacterium]
QTPGAGEDYFERQLERSVEERAGVFERFGVSREQAVLIARLDRTMVDCVLALYRSAVDVAREWAPEFRDVPKPGLVVVPSEDPFLSPEAARTAAERSGAEVVGFVGFGHWWMLQDPARGAATLEEFWASLAGRSW